MSGLVQLGLKITPRNLKVSVDEPEFIVEARYSTYARPADGKSP